MRFKQVTVEDRTFKNFQEACNYYKIDYAKTYSRIKAGWSIEEAFEIKPKGSCTVEGISFKSVRQASLYYNKIPQVVCYRIRNGWTLEESLDVVKRKIDYNCKGKLYKIINTVNDKIYLGITTATLVRRLAEHKNAALCGKNTKFYKALRQIGVANFKIVLIKEYTDRHKLALDEIKYIKKYNTIAKGYNSCRGGNGLSDGFGKPITYEGITFISQKALADHLGIAEHNLYTRLKNKEDFRKPVNTRNKPKIKYRNKIYTPVQLSKSLGVDVCTIKYRLGKNYCLNGPPRMTNNKGYYKGTYTQGGINVSSR